jgi:hypothetical protein
MVLRTQDKIVFDALLASIGEISLRETGSTKRAVKVTVLTSTVRFGDMSINILGRRVN